MTAPYPPTGGAKKDRSRAIPMTPEDSILAEAEGTTPVQFRQGLAATGVPDIGLAKPQRNIFSEALDSAEAGIGRIAKGAGEAVKEFIQGPPEDQPPAKIMRRK